MYHGTIVPWYHGTRIVDDDDDRYDAHTPTLLARPSLPASSSFGRHVLGARLALACVRAFSYYTIMSCHNFPLVLEYGARTISVKGEGHVLCRPSVSQRSIGTIGVPGGDGDGDQVCVRVCNIITTSHRTNMGSRVGVLGFGHGYDAAVALSLSQLRQQQPPSHAAAQCGLGDKAAAWQR